MGMADPTSTVTPGTSENGRDTNYITVALAVGIPCSVVIIALILLISAMFYLTCKTPRRVEEAVYMRRRFQGISLEQQRKAKVKKKKRRVMGRRESGISGNFNAQLSRSPSSLSAAAQINPFGLQEWQIRMYGGSGGVGGSRGGGVGGARGGGEGSPDTEETDISGDEVFHHRGSGLLAGAINPLMIQGQDHDPGYDTPPRSSHKHHPLTHQHRHHHTSQPSQKSSEVQDTSSDDSMNPYDK